MSAPSGVFDEQGANWGRGRFCFMRHNSRHARFRIGSCSLAATLSRRRSSSPERINRGPEALLAIRTSFPLGAAVKARRYDLFENQSNRHYQGRLAMEAKSASHYTRLGGYDAIAAVVDDYSRSCVRTSCSVDFGLAPAALTPTTVNANWRSILSRQPPGPDHLSGQGHEDVAQRDGHHEG
jgi:hypothetical protein